MDVEQQIDSQWARIKDFCFEGIHMHAGMLNRYTLDVSQKAEKRIMLGGPTLMCCQAFKEVHAA